MSNTIRDVSALATRRRLAPWTQAELAAAAGVSVGTVRRIEHHASVRVSLRVRRALANALGVAPAAIAEFRPAPGLALPSSQPARPPNAGAHAPSATIRSLLRRRRADTPVIRRLLLSW
jgi:transcriptional regulator with XRE-family HTH domain